MLEVQAYHKFLTPCKVFSSGAHNETCDVYVSCGLNSHTKIESGADTVVFRSPSHNGNPHLAQGKDYYRYYTPTEQQFQEMCTKKPSL